MLAHPWTRFQARSTGNRTNFGALVVDTTLAAGFFALAVASLILGVALTPAKVLTIQCTFAIVFDVFDAGDSSRSTPFDIQVSFLTLPAFSLTLCGTTAHGLITKLSAFGGGWILVASNLFRVLAVGKLLQDLLLALHGVQIFELVAESGGNSQMCHKRRITPKHTTGPVSLRDHRAREHWRSGMRNLRRIHDRV